MEGNYVIERVEFSTRTDIINSNVVEFTNKVGVPHDEQVILVANIYFKYMLGGQEYAGTAIRDLATICTISYTEVDDEIKATSITQGDRVPTEQEVNDAVESAVESEYAAIAVERMASSVEKLYLAKTNQACSYTKDFTKVDIPSYPELDAWTTGVGKEKINFSSRPIQDPWEYPVQSGNTLSITQVYNASLSGDTLTLE